LHITPAHGLVVNVVTAGTVPREHALDSDLGKLAPLATGAVIGIVKHQFHAGAARWLAGRGAVEDDVLHGLSTQFAGTALAQHPAHGIHDIGLATAIGPHHAYQLAWKQEIGGFSKRLEARKFDRGETHRRPF
jgi:hypothetical protein